MSTRICNNYSNCTHRLTQECIPVGCVPTAAVAATRYQHQGCVPQGVCLHGICPNFPPPFNRQTGVKTLPSLAVGKNTICRSPQTPKCWGKKSKATTKATLRATRKVFSEQLNAALTLSRPR